MVMSVDDEKKILNALLDDDESFIVKKRKSSDERIESIVKQVRETIKKRTLDEESKEDRQAQIERLERIKRKIEDLNLGVSELEKAVSDEKLKAEFKEVKKEKTVREESKPTEVKSEKVMAKLEPKFKELPYLSDVEINVLKSIIKYGANIRRVSKATGYPEVVITKAIEKLIEKGYLDENLNVAEKAIHLAGVPTEEGRIGVKIIDVAIILTAIVLVLSTLYYLGYLP